MHPDNELKQLKKERVKQLEERVKELLERNKELSEQNKRMANIFEKVIDMEKWNSEQMQILNKELLKERDKERFQRLERALQVSNLLCQN